MGNVEKEATGKVEASAWSDEKLVESKARKLIAEEKVGGVELNRSVDGAIVDVRLNRNPFSSVETDEGVKGSPDKVLGLGESPNGNWDQYCGPG